MLRHLCHETITCCPTQSVCIALSRQAPSTDALQWGQTVSVCYTYSKWGPSFRTSCDIHCCHIRGCLKATTDAVSFYILLQEFIRRQWNPPTMQHQEQAPMYLGSSPDCSVPPKHFHGSLPASYEQPLSLGWVHDVACRAPYMPLKSSILMCKKESTQSHNLVCTG